MRNVAKNLEYCQPSIWFYIRFSKPKLANKQSKQLAALSEQKGIKDRRGNCFKLRWKTPTVWILWIIRHLGTGRRVENWSLKIIHWNKREKKNFVLEDRVEKANRHLWSRILYGYSSQYRYSQSTTEKIHFIFYFIRKEPRLLRDLCFSPMSASPKFVTQRLTEFYDRRWFFESLSAKER